jgi:hypothetical protein
MDILDRVRALPQELQDEIFPYLLLPEPSVCVEKRQQYYNMPVPRAKITLSYLVSHMTAVLENNVLYGLNWAQATLCVVRIFQI